MKLAAKLITASFFVILIMTMMGCSETALVEAGGTTEWANTANALRGDLIDDEIEGLNLDSEWLKGDAE